MFKTKALVWAGGLLLLAGTAAGCNKNKLKNDAFLDLNTRILIHESNLGDGKNLEVSVVDKRRRNTLMKRDSERKIRSGRALVLKDYHPSLRLDTHFQQTATEAFQMQGYETNGKGAGSPRFFCPEPFVGKAVPAFVAILIYIALVVEGLQDFADDSFMSFFCGADEVVVGNVQAGPQFLEAVMQVVNVRLRGPV